MEPARDLPAPLILLVEDDLSVREALTFALKIEGFAVEVHDRAETLLDRCGPLAAACLVLDQHLPGSTGVEALAELRRRGLTCPAILITTQPKPAVRSQAEALGARILEKPLLGGELPACIRELLGH
ncbi:response regulator [Phenylobacterium sp.]|uniref:response regulator n=1 Tax=Phenylobacterium sp. TaxID=1871053 RepID=UPI00121C58D4|nr:response regulator [Phenylobacterium sp.]THD62173.1 MAG: response regulator [Phenylobacterium sp.]